MPHRTLRHVWPLLALVAMTSVGCSSLRPDLSARSAYSQTRQKLGDAPPKTGSEIGRVSYIEEKYREEPVLIKPEKPSVLDSFSPTNVKAAIKGVTGYGPDPKIARQLFVEAEDVYAAALRAPEAERNSQLAAAGAKYAAAADRWPGSVLEHDALFKAGECFFFADQYPKANEQYEKLVKAHPNSRYMDVIDAHRFSIAQYWLDLDQTAHIPFYAFNVTNKSRPWYDTSGHAFRVFDRIRIDDPTGKLSDDATLAAANAHFAAGKYLKADDLYTDLRKTFPSSEHQFLAHFLGLKSKLLSYQGPDYSGDALDQAEQLVKQIRKQFPQQAEAEREFLAKSFAEIRFRKAERLWTMGLYHELRTEYGASNYYFQQILKDFADTPFVEQAQQHMQEHAGKPPVPPQPLEWLTQVFPKTQPQKPLIKSDDVSVSSAKGARRR